MTCETATTEDLILGEETSLRRFARRLARCSSDADDLVQETLLRAYANRARFQPGTSIRAWTFTILRRLFLTRALAEKRRRTQLDCDSAGLLAQAPGPCRPTSSDGPPPIDDLVEVLHDDALAAFEGLPEWYRGPFYLFAVQEMTCLEISRKLGIPTGTVMSRIHRARARLRSTLARGRDRRVGPVRDRMLREDSARRVGGLPRAS